MSINFQNFLMKLGFSKEELKENLSKNVFNYSIGSDYISSLKYIHTPSQIDIFQQHQLLWNQNSEPVFIAVTDNKTFIINVKEKPDKNSPLKNSICIKSFHYGTNTIGFENIDDNLISKVAIDSSFFFDFISKNQKKNQSVDKDLLLNLLALKKDLVSDGNEEIVHLLILRCLFIKYLEDRGIFNENYLLKILESSDKKNLKEAFEEVAKINGDVFKFDDFDFTKIKIEYLNQLSLFFKSDYRSGQQYLFPYKFDQIPIQLISHVYEAFLKGSTKKGKGVYYTPSFLVDFMLSHSFSEKIEQNPQATLLDPAVGSGAFLVQAFKIIQKSQGDNLSFQEKKRILEEQLFGIDVDANALQIAAFSLYLALLETEDSQFIKNEIKNSNPILPSLIGRTLVQKNTLLDDVFPQMTFDCISSNPPWGSVPTEQNEEYIRERNAIDNKQGSYPEYENVADYERSQAFLTRVSQWGNDDTVYSMVVKNSIFLNDKTKTFRVDLLQRFHVDTFYELSHYNKILFKKTVIGKINEEKIEIGASEPCVVLKFRKKTNDTNKVTYISPKLTDFSKYFEIIHYSNRDRFEVSQSEFIKKDSLWKVLVNGDVEIHDLIIKLERHKDLKIEARSGFQPKKDMESLGNPIWRKLILPSDFEQFNVKNKNLALFNWNQKLHRRRDESIFESGRVLISVRPLKSDNLMFRGVYIEDNEVYKDDILSLKFKESSNYIDNYLPYLAIINSHLIGFLFFQLSIQWGKGEGKRDTIRNIDVENLPIKEVKEEIILSELTGLIKTIQKNKSSNLECSNEIKLINEIVFNHYGLSSYEKEIVKEFYDVKVNRANSISARLRIRDLEQYFEIFQDAFSLILSNENKLVARYNISSNLGAIIAFSIVSSNNQSEDLQLDSSMDLLHFVKSKQLTSSDSTKILFEEKVKIYNKDTFYIIKSNQFKDWTARQAMKDAKEEIGLFINQLPTVNE